MKFVSTRFVRRNLLRFERLESRDTPATFTVTNLLDTGTGSLRQAITSANSTVGADTIDFIVAGTITLASALPAITDQANIDGSTAPGFTSSPLVQLDNAGFSGLSFAPTSVNSILRSLSIVNASGAGVTVNAPQVLIAGNYIGLQVDGTTPGPNGGAGLFLDQLALRCIVGTVDALDRNVVSGNKGDGIVLNGSFENKIIANFVGTDKTGALEVGNGGNGVLLTAGASTNAIGGMTPAAAKFVNIAPEGNLISGNGGNGILITLNSTTNLVAANFVGTNLAGNAALGNTLDGIAISKGSNNNSILGTVVNEEPFIFMNLVSGNTGNGIHVTDSNNTVIHANVTGLSVDNNHKLGNLLNGVLIDGDSTNTTYGGVIPLGNVTSGNGLNGVSVAGTASFFTAFNTFAGIAAFNTNNTLGNVGDGFNITSTGGNNVLRTNVLSGNGDDGLEISGDATSVTVVQNIIGMDTKGEQALGNADNGVEISGNANNILIGGTQIQFSVIQQNGIGANGSNGIAVLGSAHDIAINFSNIGTDLKGLAAIPNAKAGILLDSGSSNVTIGSTNPLLTTVVSANTGAGIQLNGTTGNTVVNTIIGLDISKANALPNGGDGILIASSSNNRIGGTGKGEGNVIANNTGSGVNVASGSGNSIERNSIYSNGALGITVAAGANNNQAAPFLTNALRLTDGLRITGTVAGTPNTAYTVEFFTGTVADTGEGRTYFGALQTVTDANGIADITFVTSLPPAGSTIITATATDALNNTSPFSNSKSLTSFLVAVPGASIQGGDLQLFPATFTGESRTVIADFNGDGIVDLAAATGPGSLSLVRVLDGATGTELFNITPFGAAFTGGLFVTAGDITGDGKADLAITAGLMGGTRVRLFNGSNFSQINDFFGIDDVNFRGGSAATFGDINGDGTLDLAVTAGAGGGPRVALYNGSTIAQAKPVKFVGDFFAYDSSFRAGVYVASGDVNSDGKADLIFGPGSGGGPQVRVLDGTKLLTTATFNADGTVSGADLISFFARSNTDRGGIRVAVRNLDGDSKIDIVTRSDSGNGHDDISFLGKSVSVGTIRGEANLDNTFDDFSNAIFVG